MKKIPLILICLSLSILSQAVQSKVLLVVEKGYYTSNTAKINTYLSDIINIDKNTAEVFPAGGFDKTIGATNIDRCRRLWYLLRDKYASAHGTSDSIEGAVLIGDIPVPMFALTANALENSPLDYYYTDLWCREVYDFWTGLTIYDKPWNSDSEIFPISSKQQGFFETTDRYHDRKGRNDMWVSRVYASSIKNVLTGKDGITILGEPGVLNEYLDRVHERMTLPAKVPPRYITMRSPWGPWDLDDQLGLERSTALLGLSEKSSTFRFPQASPSKWQAMLQAGPRGNINNGGFVGNDINNIDYSTTDVAGYEWAGTFFHSSPNLSQFFSAGGDLSLGGGDFLSSTDESYGIWKKETGGYSGTSWRMDMGAAKDYTKYRTATWAYTIQNDGSYDVYLYSSANPANCTKVGVYTGELLQGEVKEGIVRSFYIVNQRNPYPGNWCLLASNQEYKATQIMYANLSNKDWGTLNPALAPPWAADGPIRASAIKLVNKSVTPNTSIIIDAVDNITDLSKTKRFFTSNNNRGYINFTKNGGPSKTPFFMNQGCNLSRFTTTNNLGLLYAMGYNGLITVGCGQEMSGNYYYDDYTSCLFQGNSFGKALISAVPDYNYLYENDLNILGAGTLRADAYKPYYNDYTIANKSIASNAKYAARNSIIISNTTINSGVTSKIKAGNTITINGPFTVSSGSILTLAIDPTLK